MKTLYKIIFLALFLIIVYKEYTTINVSMSPIWYCTTIEMYDLYCINCHGCDRNGVCMISVNSLWRDKNTIVIKNGDYDFNYYKINLDDTMYSEVKYDDTINNKLLVKDLNFLPVPIFFALENFE